ncbi:MAG: alpha/beta fold hydrolase [Actinomycetota bacterium]|nr:alpha/beta hydrolase [Actinomycetota bacterium]
MQEAQAHSVKLAWHDVGAGNPPVLAVPQWFLSSRSLGISPLIQKLSERHRVILYDRRGTGASEKPGPPYTTARDARDLAGLVEATSLDGFVLLGLGVRGSQVALNYAGHFPQRVRALITIGGTPKWSASAEWPYGIAAGTYHKAFASVLADASEAPALPDDPALADAMRADWSDAGPDAATDILAHTLDEDLRPFLRKVVSPALVVHLRDDPLVSFEAARWLAESLANGQLEVFDASRNVPLQSPGELAAHIEEFLATAL